MKPSLLVTSFIAAIPCTSNPCLHGTCTDTPSGFRCSCDARYTGAKCDQSMYTELFKQFFVVNIHLNVYMNIYLE